MLYRGHLRKMRIRAQQPVEYALILSEQEVPLNAYLGQELRLNFTGNIHCIHCGRRTSKSFQQGYCFPCLQRLLSCDLCVIHPEKCRVEQGGCSPEDWAHAQCGATHIVYLANSSGLKVGVTRLTQTPTRWLDQGACQALPIFQTANRYQAGLIEVCLKQFVNDKTDWRRLLRQSAAMLDLIGERTRLMGIADSALAAVLARFSAGDIIPLTENTVFTWDYPVSCYPEKAVSLSFDQNPVVAGRLQGMKGQYLLLSTGVINIRKFAGYEVELSCY
jgi:Protein of unknown function (DUF2797)